MSAIRNQQTLSGKLTVLKRTATEINVKRITGGEYEKH